MKGIARRVAKRTSSGCSNVGVARRCVGARVRCLPSRCGPYNSRDDDDNCFITGVPELQAPSNAQPSGWIRLDASRHYQPNSPVVGGGAGARSFKDAAGSCPALPFSVFSTAYSDCEQTSHTGGGLPSSQPPGTLSSAPGPAAAAMRAVGSFGQHLVEQLWTLTDQPGIDMFLAGPMVWGKLREVFVILFGVDGWDTEGIYSLRAFCEGEAPPQETIIAFESEEDAQRYASLLEATMDHVPYVCAIVPRELLDFCLDEGYNCRMEPAQSLLIPPDCNVGMTDWERSFRLRSGQWAVLSNEPHDSPAPSTTSASSSSTCVASSPGLMLMGPAAASSSTATASPSATVTPSSTGDTAAGKSTTATGTPADTQRVHPGSNVATLARYVGMSGGELEKIRGRLERLLLFDA